MAFAAILDDISLRRYNTQIRQRLELLNKELEEADAQCVRYMETISHERQGKARVSKKECGKCV